MLLPSRRKARSIWSNIPGTGAALQALQVADYVQFLPAAGVGDVDPVRIIRKADHMVLIAPHVADDHRIAFRPLKTVHCRNTAVEKSFPLPGGQAGANPAGMYKRKQSADAADLLPGTGR